MTDFLLELRSEEIPARMQAKARDDLARLFTERLTALGVTFGEVVTYATPRRLALIVRDLPDNTAASSEERKGPRADAPAQAIEGFLRSTGLSREQLVERDDGKGNTVLFAVIQRPGLPVPSVLANACAHVIHAFPWPKSMRWGDASASTECLRWVRPLQGIVALFGPAIVEFEIAGVRSGATTRGHRFHHPGDITIGSAADYVEKLRACHVIVDQAERAAIIATGATMLTAAAGLTLVRDEGLLAENAGLTEWPVPLLGRFDPEFLDVPPEVIQLTARVNQKYFVAQDGAGKLANAFVCVANIDAADGGEKIVEGNRKVLAARLSDARFFYDTDLKTKLEDLTPKLEKIVFHEKLGTVADKVDRVAKLARWLAEEGIVPGADPAKAERAARLAKADLVTGMVGEFPELQGLMGGYYAAAQGQDAEVAAAVRDHYKPVGQGDDVPTAPVTVAVSLADKLDTLAGFYLIKMPPSGSRDPYALRRAAIAASALMTGNGVRLPLLVALLNAMIGYIETAINWSNRELPKAKQQTASLKRWTAVREFATAQGAYFDIPMPEIASSELKAANDLLKAARFPDAHAALNAVSPILDFFADRLKVQQREAGVRHDLIDAVFALGAEDDLVRLLARVRALQAFVATSDGANLLAGYKRSANILKKENWGAPAKAGALADEAPASPTLRPSPEHSETKPLSYTPERAEGDLIAALDAAEPAAADAVAREDFECAMTALATLRAPIDAFFDSVTVNDPDPDKRAARLALLARVRAAVHTVADFSKIEG